MTTDNPRFYAPKVFTPLKPGAVPLSRMGTGPACRQLIVELLVIDLQTCARCVPTDAQLKKAVKILEPTAEALGIDLVQMTTVVKSREEALRRALHSSPTIRINGLDIAQDIRESRCESCAEIVGAGASVDCREWHYKGSVYPAAPLPFLLESIMEAMLKVDSLSRIEPEPLDRLPENLERFFSEGPGRSCCN